MHVGQIRLVANREWLDLLRDRRTLLLIFGLPILLYPVFGAVGFLFAQSIVEQKTLVGVVGKAYAPQNRDHPEAAVAGATYLALVDMREIPGLFDGDQFLGRWVKDQAELGRLVVVPLDPADGSPEAKLEAREIDVLLTLPENLVADLETGKRPGVQILSREGDETSKLALKRVNDILRRWQERLKIVRFTKAGLPTNYDEPIEIVDPQDAKPLVTKTAEEIRDRLVKFIPFLLVMWTLAGALHPAVDLTAGEKERGTMETLLISPARRREIVLGKFFAITAFSYLTTIWNVLFLAASCLFLGRFLPFPIVSMMGLAWCVLLAIPPAMLFAAIGLSLGVYARSTKEGQYYLMPLFMVALPLTLFSMTPGLKLSLLLSCVPLTGLSMLEHQLLSVAGEPVPWYYWVTSLTSLMICVVVSLELASWQFRRERVLFREAERTTRKGLFAFFGTKRA